MNPPFNLIRVFSLSSLVTTALLTFILSWFLSNNLENQLLEREKQLTEKAIATELLEELEELEISFEDAPLNTEFRNEMIEFVTEIHGGQGVDMIQTSGEVIWSTYPEKIGTHRKGERLRQAQKGETSIVILENEKDPSVSDISSYIPLLQDEKVLGILEFHREDPHFLQQIQTVKEAVYLYCVLFGAGLYIMMMVIIVPAARMLNKQHQQLIEAKERLIENERLSAIGEVCGAVAHGLKNPIASVRAAVQLLSVRSVVEEKRNKIVSDILHEVDRLTKRLHDLLNFIRPFDPELQYVKLQDVLNNATRSLYWKAEKENIQFKIHPSSDSINAYIDATLLEEAVLIVLSNAMEASKPGDTVQCSIEAQNGHHVIVVEDQGKGIPKEILPQVFEQFFTTRSQGVGLGLPLCKKIMELHQGEVTIESKINQGTIVKLFIPQHVPAEYHESVHHPYH